MGIAVYRVGEQTPIGVSQAVRRAMAEIEPDFFVGNFRGEEFDSAFQAVTDLVALDKIGIDEAVDRIIADCQAVLDKEPA